MIFVTFILFTLSADSDNDCKHFKVNYILQIFHKKKEAVSKDNFLILQRLINYLACLTRFSTLKSGLRLALEFI